MIDIRYFLDRQNAGREEVPERPLEPTPSQPQTPARHTTVVRADGRTVLDLMGPKIEPLTSFELCWAKTEESRGKGTMPAVARRKIGAAMKRQDARGKHLK